MPAARAADSRLPEPSYPKVVAELGAGRVAEALDALDAVLASLAPGDPAVEATALRAELLLRGGRARESVALWDELARREPALGDLARRRGAEALMAAGDPGAAVERIGRPSRAPATRAHHDLLLAAATRYREIGQPAPAAELARAILTIERRGPLADAAGLALAAALEATGDRAGAIAVLRDAQRGFRSPAAFVRARAEERRLAAALGRQPERFSESDYRRMADRLAGRGRFADAIETLQAWRAAWPTSVSLEDIEAEIIENHYRAWANDQALAGAAEFARQRPSSPLLPRIRLLEFRIAVRQGRTADVKARGFALWRGQSGLSHAARRSVGSLLASYLVSAGEVEAGLSVYRDLFAITSGRASQIDVLWRAGVAAFRTGQDERAAVNLRGVLNRRPGPDTRHAAAYWLAAVEERRGRRQEAVRLLADIVREDPFDYYGVLAGRRLAELGTPVRASEPVPFPPLELREATSRLPEFRAATVLAKAGLLSDAATFARQLVARSRGDQGAALLAARASHAAGEHRAALRLLTSHFGRYLSRASSGLPDDFWTMAYPRAFWDELQQPAAEHGVDPLLMLAIMRRESRFDPQARSPVGATGLFQIMAYTAEAIAPEVGLEIEETEEDLLAHPPRNAAIAARLLRKLLDLFGGEVVPVMASFNAGDERVGIWWAAARGQPLDLFVDTMPYSETRVYVREVYINYLTYQRLYGSEPTEPARRQ